MNVRSQNCRFDLQALNEHKLRSMKVTHRWLVQFFEDPKCFEMACAVPWTNPRWFHDLEFHMVRGERACMMTPYRAFEYFTHWGKTTGQKCAPRIETFLEDLKELGIEEARHSITRDCVCRKRNVLVFIKSEIKRSLSFFYSIPEEEFNLDWAWQDPLEYIELQKNDWRFKNPP